MTPANVCRRDPRSTHHNGEEEQLSLDSITGTSGDGRPGTRLSPPGSRCRESLAWTNQGMTHPFISTKRCVGGTRRHDPGSSTSVLVRLYYCVNPGLFRDNHGGINLSTNAPTR